MTLKVVNMISKSKYRSAKKMLSKLIFTLQLIQIINGLLLNNNKLNSNSKLFATVGNNIKDITKKSYLYNENSEVNFDDNDVDCTSEGGTWKYIPFDDNDKNKLQNEIINDEKELLLLLDKAGAKESWTEILSLLIETYTPNAENVIILCDRIDSCTGTPGKFKSNIILRFKRQLLLGDILRRNREEYITIASFLANRIPRNELPNVQNVPYPDYGSPPTPVSADDLPVVSIKPTDSFTSHLSGEDLVDDCTIPKATYQENPLDKLLLYIFRGLVQKEIGFKSEVAGIRGLLEEGRHYKLSDEGTINDSVNQHNFVKKVLGDLLTPALPPFYRLFMSGMVPSVEAGDPEWLVNASNKLIDVLPDFLPFKEKLVPGNQLGPWFYAPFLTSVVTPPFLSFLLGPSHVNLRKDGGLGGMVVEKCKFLQESNCKGLCLHQCKIPAQEFFQDTLGMPLTVSPNFATQECQWSWGEKPLPHTQDPDFPKGCISGCETRALVQ